MEELTVMKLRFFSCLVAVVMMMGIVANAADFVKLGECPVTKIDSNPSAIVLDPLENEIYGNAVEITWEEFYAASPSDTDNPLIPLRGSVWITGATPYNDGLKKELQKGYHDLYGEDQQWEAYTDMGGNVILSALPGGWQRTWEYFTHYNFGYMTEANMEFYWEEYADAFGSDYDFAVSAITDVFTGKVYRINTVSIMAIDNNGYIYFSIPSLRNGEYSNKFYKASLKKAAAVTVFYNGNKIAFDQVPQIVDGRTLVPLRAIFETLGAGVNWDPATSTVTAAKDGVSVSLTVNSTKATKNGESVELDVPAQIVNGRTLVPVRFVSDCFDVNVEWDETMKKVSLTSK